MYLVTVQTILKRKLIQVFLYKKPYLRSNYTEANIEEDVDLKNHSRIKNLPDPITIREPASKNFVDKLFNDLSILKNYRIHRFE